MLMSKFAVVTIVIGDRHKKISELTLPSQIEYAKKLNADFIIYDHDQYRIYSHENHIENGKQNLLTINSKKIRISKDNQKEMLKSDFGCYNKMNLVELLDMYERVLFVDTDIIIRDDSPDIFKIVPKDRVAMWREPNAQNRYLVMKAWCDFYNLNIKNWDENYYNSGVILFSRGHEKLFSIERKIPTKEDLPDDIWYEQTLINSNIFEHNIKMFKISHHFNRIFFLDPLISESRYDSFFIHYAGSWFELEEGNTQDPKSLISLIKHDIKIWEENSPKHNYEKTRRDSNKKYEEIFWTIES
jgi:hypothetical protein